MAYGFGGNVTRAQQDSIRRINIGTRKQPRIRVIKQTDITDFYKLCTHTEHDYVLRYEFATVQTLYYKCSKCSFGAKIEHYDFSKGITEEQLYDTPIPIAHIEFLTPRYFK
jgi:hypothetical protein